MARAEPDARPENPRVAQRTDQPEEPRTAQWADPPEEPRVARWADRLNREPEIDIDFWALLVEARIIQPQ